MWCSVIRIVMFNVVQILGQIEWTCEQRKAQLLLIQTWWQTGGKMIATAFAQKTFALSIELDYVAMFMFKHCAVQMALCSKNYCLNILPPIDKLPINQT